MNARIPGVTAVIRIVAPIDPNGSLRELPRPAQTAGLAMTVIQIVGAIHPSHTKRSGTHNPVNRPCINIYNNSISISA